MEIEVSMDTETKSKIMVPGAFRRNKRTTICAYCGKEFNNHQRNKRFCNIKCCEENYKVRKPVIVKPLKIKTVKINTFCPKKCLQCDNMFLPKSNHGQLYCSTRCCTKHWRDK